MKNYQKPNFDIKSLASNENIATLNDWLTALGGSQATNYSQASITTFIIQSL